MLEFMKRWEGKPMDDLTEAIICNMATILHPMGQFDAAIKWLKTALAYDIHNSSSHLLMVQIQISAGDLAEAENYFDVYRQVCPTTPENEELWARHKAVESRLAFEKKKIEHQSLVQRLDKLLEG
jgi:Tfp pilus assembly protein PilF